MRLLTYVVLFTSQFSGKTFMFVAGTFLIIFAY